MNFNSYNKAKTITTGTKKLTTLGKEGGSPTKLRKIN